MRTGCRRTRLLQGMGLVVLFAAVGPASAQIPDEFTNLEVLPKDIDKRELVDVMREFSGALGVRCTHCHPGKAPGSLEGVDFASDELEAKKVARAMMKIVDEVNVKLMPTAGRESPIEVRCVTCHRGLDKPESLDRVLLAAIDEGGVDAGVDKYRELREQYYGKGSYAFGPGTLGGVAEILAQERNDLDGAITLMKLEVEMAPDVSFSHMMLGQLYAIKGDKAAAVASIERGLELDPGNERAKRMLEKLRSPE